MGFCVEKREKTTLLITGAWKYSPSDEEKIKSLGFAPVFMQDERTDLPVAPEKIEGMICNGLFLFHDYRKFTSLKFVQVTSAGLDRVPVKELEAAGVKVFSAAGVYSVPMAEFAVLYALSIYKNFTFFSENKKNKVWEKDRNLKELCGKTVLIVGCGSVGQECAKRLKSFGCNIVGVVRNKRVIPSVDEVITFSDLDAALCRADIVVVSLPLNNSTENLFGEERFKTMKDGSLFINLSRGKIVKESALIDALNDKKLIGAALDVFETEPIDKDSPLWQTENLIITPHNSFVGEGNASRLSEKILSNLKDL